MNNHQYLSLVTVAEMVATNKPRKMYSPQMVLIL